jgi:hypothetical protein
MIIASTTTATTSTIILTNGVPTSARDIRPDSRPGQSISWKGFTTPEGWAMDGTFGTRVNKKSLDPEFLFYMTVLAPKGSVLTTGNIFQMWASFFDVGKPFP